MISVPLFEQKSIKKIVRSLGDLKTPKIASEINWPLAAATASKSTHNKWRSYSGQINHDHRGSTSKSAQQSFQHFPYCAIFQLNLYTRQDISSIWILLGITRNFKNYFFPCQLYLLNVQDNNFHKFSFLCDFINLNGIFAPVYIYFF